MSQNIGFLALSTVTGKGVTQAQKVAQHRANGAEVGALVAAGIGRKVIIDELAADGLNKTIHALAHGNIRPAAALVVAKSGKSVSIMEIDGKAPYSEFLRLGATLQGMAQHNKAGKPTPAAKAFALWQTLKSGADMLRAEKFNKGEKAISAPLESAPL